MPYSTQAQLGSSTRTSELRRSQSQCDNPVLAARADMLVHNQQLAEGQAKSTIQDAIHHNWIKVDEEMQAQSWPASHQSISGLMDDHEETHVHTKLFAVGKHVMQALLHAHVKGD